MATNYQHAYLKTTEPDHPLATANGQVPTHRKAFFDAFGWGPHPCLWCHHSVLFNSGPEDTPPMLVVDHIDGNKRNNNLDNLAAACDWCNVHRTLWALIEMIPCTPGMFDAYGDWHPAKRLHMRTHLWTEVIGLDEYKGCSDVELVYRMHQLDDINRAKWPTISDWMRDVRTDRSMYR